MSADLERRYARLLHLYPAAYRRARGAELLNTLLESAEEGRKRPAAREVRALTLGALRAHAGRDRPGSVRLSWLAACRAAALMLLVYDLADRAVVMVPDVAHEALNLAALALGAYAVSATMRGRFRSAIATATAAFLLAWWAIPGPGLWNFPLAVVLLVPLVRHRPPPVAGLVRYAPLLALLLVIADQGLSQLFPEVSGILQRGFLLALCLGGLLWLVVDERLAMALGLLLLNALLIQLTAIAQGGIRSWAAVAVALTVTGFMPAVLLLASGMAARRRMRI